MPKRQYFAGLREFVFFLTSNPLKAGGLRVVSLQSIHGLSKLRRSILIVGNSHVECFRSAEYDRDHLDVEVLNFGSIPGRHELRGLSAGQIVTRFVENKDPASICICLKGNEHNVLGLVEQPDPLSIGEPADGAVPVNERRWYVP